MRVWEIERLTIPELVLALDQDLDETRRPGLPHGMSAQQYAEWWRSQTPWDRYQRALSRRK